MTTTKPTKVPVRGIAKQAREKLDQVRRMASGACVGCRAVKAIALAVRGIRR